MKRLVIWEFMNFSYELFNNAHIVEVPFAIGANDAVEMLAKKGYGDFWKIR